MKYYQIDGWFCNKKNFSKIPIFIIQEIIGPLHWRHEIRIGIIFFYSFENYILISSLMTRELHIQVQYSTNVKLEQMF